MGNTKCDQDSQKELYALYYISNDVFHCNTVSCTQYWTRSLADYSADWFELRTTSDCHSNWVNLCTLMQVVLIGSIWKRKRWFVEPENSWCLLNWGHVGTCTWSVNPTNLVLQVFDRTSFASFPAKWYTVRDKNQRPYLESIGEYAKSAILEGSWGNVLWDYISGLKLSETPQQVSFVFLLGWWPTIFSLISTKHML